jgi:hypothetical protein
MAKIDEARAKADVLRKQLAQLDRLTGQTDLREREAARKRTERAAVKTVTIHECEDRARRLRLEADDEAWLMWYFAPESGSEAPFTYEFAGQQRTMIKAIGDAITFGDDKALAASRGEGKTMIFERLTLKYTLAGVIKFSVLFAATGSAAQDSLESIKAELECNVRLLADYPEVCEPVRALENTPNRAHYQLVSGRRFDTGEEFERVSSGFSWCGHEIYMPKVPGAPAAGAIIATRGLDSAIRGIKKKGRRVDLAGIDDPDTEESVRSPEQAQKLEDRIERAIAGLGGQQRRVARVMLTTIQNRTCVSHKFTDPLQKPSWNGLRMRFLITPPERTDLWEEYVRLRQIDWRAGTTAAHDFYVANREEMERGAEVANPNRFTARQISALQFYYDEVARLGPEAVATELDSDPPEEEGPQTSGITAALVESRTNGLEQRTVSVDEHVLVAAIDLGKYACHWVVQSWLPRAVGLTVDYGVQEVVGTGHGDDRVAVNRAIYNALMAWRDDLLRIPYADIDGQEHRIQLAMIDSGDFSEAVYQFVRDVGGLPFVAAKGTGDDKFRMGEESEDRKLFDHCYAKHLINDGIWLYNLDTNHWKHWLHDRFLTPTFNGDGTFRDGSLSIWSPGVPGQHHSFGRHLVAEQWQEEFIEGKGWVRGWKKLNKNNHWLDASYMGCAAAGVKGVKLLADVRRPAPRSSRPANRFQSPGGVPYMITQRSA